MFQTKIRKVGNSSVVTISAEMLAALDVKDGDTVYVTRSDDNGLKIQAHDPALLAAGDHNGSTFYQHQKFLDVVRNGTCPEVGLIDGIWAVRMGQAAQLSAQTGESVTFDMGWATKF